MSCQAAVAEPNSSTALVAQTLLSALAAQGLDEEVIGIGCAT
jgi:hypothetical protein